MTTRMWTMTTRRSMMDTLEALLRQKCQGAWSTRKMMLFLKLEARLDSGMRL